MRGRAAQALLLWLISGASSILAAEVSLVEVVDSGGQPIANAVVYREPGQSAGLAEKAAPAVIDQIDKQFVPQVTVIQVGREIQFRNSDVVSHHVYSFAQPNNFELPLYKSSEMPVVKFEHPGIVVLGCNIHDSMIGYIVVVGTPNFKVASDAGMLQWNGDVNVLNDDRWRVWSPLFGTTEASFASLQNSSADRAGSVTFRLRVSERMKPTAQPGKSSLSWDDY
jgi:plastocyanin